MPNYKAPLRDFQFLLHEFLHVEDQFPELTPDLTSPVLEEGAKFCEGILFPLNQSGDEEGVRLEAGNVLLPKGFKEAYQAYVAGGWPSLTCDPTYGGQGLPDVLAMPFTEMICSANLSFGLIPGLTHGAYNALYLHASDELKNRFLPKMVDGSWTGVMCLTEPQCGTDLGLIRTTAISQEDGSYTITGTKIFISCGDQDASENIIHLVLARMENAPKGIKGISLFVVPKIMEDGAENSLSCGAIEHKMGIHASPTCVMNYDNAVGYLVGEAHKGMKAMFTMMNEARIYVGVQGLGLAEVSYQNASAYAKERLQGRSLKGSKYLDKPADPLLVHPDVRRMLLSIRAFTEGARALALFTALKSDKAKKGDSEAENWVQLATPIVKAYLTDGGYESANLGMQVLGGYGYIREYGMEQYARDARIAQIYEGTNGIQALDLVGRKLPLHTGRLLRSFFHPVNAFIESERDNPLMEEFTKPLHKAVGSLQKASLWLAENGLRDPENAAAGSVEYLRLFALCIVGYMWAEMAKIALEKENEDAFYKAKLAVARFYMQKILTSHYSLLASIVAGAKPVMGMEEEWF